MFTLSTYDKACLDQHPEYNRLFQHTDLIHTLAWQQELCHEHLRHFKQQIAPNSDQLLECEARIGQLNGSKFQASIQEPAFTQIQQLFAQSKWCRKLDHDNDIVLTQDMYYVNDRHRQGVCRTRMQYNKDTSKPVSIQHVWKRKLTSILIEPRRPQTSSTTNTLPFAVRIDLSQEIPIVFDNANTTHSSPTITLSETQYVKVQLARFKWSTTYEYKSPETGLVWHYHFNRVLEGKTKCEAEEKLRQMSRHVRFECECECVNFLSVFDTDFCVRMTPIVYLFESFLVKMNDCIKLLLNDTTNRDMNTQNTMYVYVCVQVRLYVERVNDLYVQFIKQRL